jgi:hypothetical protein
MMADTVICGLRLPPTFSSLAPQRVGDRLPPTFSSLAPQRAVERGRQAASLLYRWTAGKLLSASPAGWRFVGLSLPHTHLYRRDGACLRLSHPLAHPHPGTPSFTHPHPGTPSFTHPHPGTRSLAHLLVRLHPLAYLHYPYFTPEEAHI